MIFRHPQTFSLLVVLVVAPSCTHFQPRPIDAEQSAVQLGSRRLPGGSCSLQSLIDEATRNHPDIAVARAKYESAVAALHTAGERPNPTLAISPQVVTPFKKWIAGTYGLDFDWSFETAGKRSKRQLVASALVDGAAANVIDATWKVRSAVRKAFLEVYAGEQRSRLLNEAIQLQADLLKAFDDRIKAGSESRSAASQARLLQAQLKLQAAENARLTAQSRAALAEALAMSMQGIDKANFSFKAFENPNPGIPGKAKALTHRADVLNALANYAAAEATLRLEIARQYPDLHLNPGYSLDSGENKWTLGVGLTLPILNRNQGAIGEAEAKRKEMAATFESVQARVLAEYEKAAAALAAARQKLATTDALVTEQEALIASEERLVQAGSGDRTGLLSARVERATTIASRVDALAEIQSALGALEEATQTPLGK